MHSARIAEKSSRHLPNLHSVDDFIYSGAEPDGVEAFEELAELGIKTVVSVDGAIPCLELAKANQLRYVHIPIGYEGISEEAGKMFAVLVRTEQGPFYIHCHHGKHRGPTAAAIAGIASGRMDDKSAVRLLERAGTSRKYTGLWQAVAKYKPPPDDAELPELAEVAELDSLAAVMAKIDRQFDSLKLCQTAEWKSPPAHPDVSPLQQALLLKESFRELHRLLLQNGDDRFLDWLKESEELMGDLLMGPTATKPSEADRIFRLLGEQCQRCHAAWRD